MRRLTLRQMACYAVRFTNYLAGPLLAAHMAAILVGLLRSSPGLEAYLLNLTPAVVITALIRSFALRRWAADPAARVGFCWKGTSLVIATWPIYVASLLQALLRIRAPFVSTPKVPHAGGISRHVVPQLIAVLALLAAAAWRLGQGGAGSVPMTILWALALAGLHWIPLRRFLEEMTGDRGMLLQTEEDGLS
jgi:hypothetical protein